MCSIVILDEGIYGLHSMHCGVDSRALRIVDHFESFRHVHTYVVILLYSTS